MKIVFFNNERELIEILEDVNNPQPYGLDEVTWEGGGYSFLENNYLILEDTVDFSTITEDIFVTQFKEQAKFSLAKILEANRINYMVAGIITEKEQQFNDDKLAIDSKNSLEELEVFMNEVKNRT